MYSMPISMLFMFINPNKLYKLYYWIFERFKFYWKLLIKYIILINKDCSLGYYSDSSNISNVTCKSCHIACASCFGSSNTSCYKCNINYFLDGTSCLTSCILNTTYANNSNQMCVKCI